MLVIAEQRHAGWGQGELQPSLGMGACDLAVQERRAGTEREQQCGFTTHETQSGEQVVRVVNAQIDVDAGRDHRRSIGGLNQGVVGVVEVGAFEALGVSEAQRASRQQREVLIHQPAAKLASW